MERIQLLEGTISQAAKAAEAEGRAEKVSVFFRDLETRRWFGVNQDASYSGGSLFKLPVMIAYLKLSEIDPSILQGRVVYQGGRPTLNQQQGVKPAESLVPGREYSVTNLIERMIIYSDNDATQVLLGLADKSYLEKVFRDFNIAIPQREGEDFVSANTYAAILRTLYNSSYLNRANSELALRILARSEFRGGLVAGLPAGTAVAHKFGEVNFVDPKSGRPGVTFHDCGIVYRKSGGASRPYCLCVMTQGRDPFAMVGVIKDLSKLVYDGVDW